MNVYIEKIWRKILEKETNASEESILKCIGKMHEGIEKYGPWNPILDSRNLYSEIESELIDAANYCVMILDTSDYSNKYEKQLAVTLLGLIIPSLEMITSGELNY
jgi:hypothetical protein